MLVLLIWLLAPPDEQTKWRFPVTIRVTQDVPVLSQGMEPDFGMRRGRLYGAGPFVIKKGQTFQMLKDEGEGGCRIRVEKREYSLGTCPWVDGFADRQLDIFQIVKSK